MKGSKKNVRKVNFSITSRVLIGLSLLFGGLLNLTVPTWWLVDAGSDDLLFVRQSHSLSNGDWLGSFAQGGSLKLPGFPAYLAFIQFFKIPFHLSLWLVASVASLLFWKLFNKNYISEKSAVVLIISTELNPFLLSQANSRIIRDGLYTALLLVLAASAYSLILHLRHKGKFSELKLEILLVCLPFFFLVITREEYVSIFLLLIIWFFLGLLLLRGRGWKPKIQLLTMLLVCIIIGSLGLAGVQYQNGKYYGISTPAGLSKGPLIDLISTWAEVEPVLSSPRISVSNSQRKIVYQNIPEVAKYEKAIESNLLFYKSSGCFVPSNCNEVGNSHLIWALFYGLLSEDKMQDSIVFRNEVASMTMAISRGCDKYYKCRSSITVFPGAYKPVSMIAVGKHSASEFFDSWKMKALRGPAGESEGSKENLELFRWQFPINGPKVLYTESEPNNSHHWVYFGTFLMILFCLSVQRQSNHKSESKLSIYLCILMSILIMRSFVLGSFDYLIADPSGSNYQLASNAVSAQMLILLLAGNHYSYLKEHIRGVTSNLKERT